MDRIDLLNDMRFSSKCYQYGINNSDFSIVDDLIVLESPKENVLVLLDENYHTVGIIDKNDAKVIRIPLEEKIIRYKELYTTTYITLPYPFNKLSVKEIVEIAERIEINETNHGHSSELIVNAEKVTDNKENEVYIQLLSYIKFLGYEIEEYFKNLYQMKVLGFSYPDLHEYLTTIMVNIDQCIDGYIETKTRPFPVHVAGYIGQERDIIEAFNKALYKIINLLLKSKGYEIKSSTHYKELDECEEDTTNLADEAKKLIKILEISEDEVEERYKTISRTFHMDEINLKTWLTKDKKQNNGTQRVRKNNN